MNETQQWMDTILASIAKKAQPEKAQSLKEVVDDLRKVMDELQAALVLMGSTVKSQTPTQPQRPAQVHAQPEIPMEVLHHISPIWLARWLREQSDPTSNNVALNRREGDQL
jgi:hypothetical protein